MTALATVTSSVNPIGDESRLRRVAKVVGWIALVAAAFGVLQAAGVDIGGWLGGLWDTLSGVSAPYLVAAVALQTVSTAFTALAWLFILRAGYPHAEITYLPILAAYAVGAGLNAVLPANLGSFVMLFMFVAIVPGGTIAGMLAAFVVEKIFFAAMNVIVYLYLFVTVPGSFSVELGGLREHPAWVALIAAGVVLLLAVVIRVFWPKLRRFWLQAKQGGAIVSSPRRYAVQVFLPSLAGYTAKLAGIGVMLAAFSIPVTAGSILHVVAGNSIATNAAATPGGAGVTQAISVVALHDYTDAQTATAYSVAHQLVGTAWGLSLAIILVLSVFGWTDGRAIVKTAYAEAKDRAAARHAKHDRPAEPAT
jgi:uncharacterized membrane protein YbhN (UPF0104 family)